MNWGRWKATWPHADHSRFVPTGGLGGVWHIQEMGSGPDIMLLHGAGGATQSFRSLMPILAKDYRCIAVDYPGQGFSRPRVSGRLSLDTLAQDLASLAFGEGWRPIALIGHSAGGALALRMAEEGVAEHVIGLNAALGRFEGMAGWAFPLAAKLMALNPLTAAFFSTTTSSPGVVKKLLESTGSDIDEEGQRLYQALISSPSHVDGTLRMMAAWNLDGLITRLPRNKARTTLIVGDRDATVPPDVSEKSAARMPDARVVRLAGLGHLAHEEAPEIVAGHVFSALSKARDSLNAE